MFVIKITSFRIICTTSGPGAFQFKFNDLFNKHFSKIFFKTILPRKKVGCSTEPVDRLGERPFDTDVILTVLKVSVAYTSAGPAPG